MSERNPVEARMNIFLRGIGLLFFIVGLLVAYYTSTTLLLPQVSVNFYLIAVIMSAIGLVTLISDLI